MTVVQDRPARPAPRIDGSVAEPMSSAVAVDRLLADAIRRAVAYADIFDWPQTAAELHRSLPIAASRARLERALAAPGAVGLQRYGDLIALPDRESLVATRRRRAAASAVLWRQARPVLRIVARLPFVRLVAITGSLAVDAAEPGADVDLLVVTAPDRLWLTRAAIILVGRIAAVRGVRLCPNYLLAESALELPERDAFTAHELAQMVPTAGVETYLALLARNAWYRDFLPNHRPPAGAEPGRAGLVRRAIEAVLGAGAFDRIERWEMRRKAARLSAGATSGEQRFDEQACKGHFDEHRRRALARYEARLADLGHGGWP